MLGIAQKLLCPRNCSITHCIIFLLAMFLFLGSFFSTVALFCVAEVPELLNILYQSKGVMFVRRTADTTSGNFTNRYYYCNRNRGVRMRDKLLGQGENFSQGRILGGGGLGGLSPLSCGKNWGKTGFLGRKPVFHGKIVKV